MFTFKKCGCVVDTVDNKVDFKPDINKIPLDCSATWDLISEGNTKGVFQLDSSSGQSWSAKVKPRSINELSDLLAIIRPGVTDALIKEKSLTNRYIDRKHLLEPVEYLHPILEPILKETYGILVYQEQALMIARQVAGFSLEEADILRKAIGKKKADVMTKVKAMFIDKAKELNKVTPEEAEEIFSWIEKSQKYSFNKCITGDTILKRDKNKHGTSLNIEEMYKIKNNLQYAKTNNKMPLRSKYLRNKHYGNYYSMCEDGRIRPNILKDIIYSGKQPVFKITLENNTVIKTSIYHKYPTANGIKQTIDLQVGDELYCCGQYEIGNNKNYGFSNITIPELRNKNRNKNTSFGFMKGKDNPGYTNGSYSEWKKNKQLLPNYCQNCEADNVKLETHHVDGNRENSSLNNLIQLCISCHKKEEYKQGRRRKGEKGYPSYTNKIINIEYIGLQEVYDIVMEGPNHNFVTKENIVTCNSHSVSYAYNAYLSAYCKTHFPKAFFTSYLYFSNGKQKPREEIHELLANAQLKDVAFTTPDIRHLNEKFKIINKQIYFGLTNIKHVGGAVYDKMIRDIKNIEETNARDFNTWTWIDFLVLLSDNINAQAVSALILSGALDHFKMDRTLMKHEYLIYSELRPREKQWLQKFLFDKPLDRKVSLYDLLDILLKTPVGKSGGIYHKSRVPIVQSLQKSIHKPGYNIKDTPTIIAKCEEMLLGFAVTCSKVDDKPTEAANCQCIDVYKNNHPDVVSVAAQVDRCKEYICKRGQNKGQTMAFLTISDSSCGIDVIAFADTYEEYKHLLTLGNTVLVRGTKDSSGKGLIIKKVLQI